NWSRFVSSSPHVRSAVDQLSKPATAEASLSPGPPIPLPLPGSHSMLLAANCEDRVQKFFSKNFFKHRAVFVPIASFNRFNIRWAEEAPGFCARLTGDNRGLMSALTP